MIICILAAIDFAYSACSLMPSRQTAWLAPVHVHTTEEIYVNVVNVSSMGAFSPALRD